MRKYLLSFLAGSLATTHPVKPTASGDDPCRPNALVGPESMITFCFLVFSLCWFSASLAAQPLFTTPGNYTYSVTSNGDLTIAVRGGDGGDGSLNGKGGSGANTRATFAVLAGDQLTVVVGGVGETKGGGGGGGGSAVILNRGMTQTLLIVAGGGGGAGFSPEANPPTPLNGIGGDGNDGTAGGGANGFIGSSPGGGGGGGFNGAGAGGGNFVSRGGAAGTLNGGGNGGCCAAFQGGDGGFGFGGGGESNTPGGGGGGGYGGGQGGNGFIGNTLASGGGSSFVSATGTNVLRTSGATGGGTQSNGFVLLFTRWHVNAAVSASGDGTSWARAFKTLREAIAAAGSGHEIWVAQGTYYPDEGPGVTDNDRGASFAMKNGVAIYGGFPNTGDPAFTNRNWTANPTILSGDIGTASNTDNSFRIINNSGLDPTAVLDGFTIRDAYNSSTSAGNDGGGMSNNNASPTIRNCIFRNNNMAANGGAVYDDNSSPAFINCLFTENSAGFFGGALFTQRGSLSLTNCTLVGNSSTHGGAITTNSGSTNTILTNCIIWNNSGGQIFNNQGGNTTVTYSIVQGGYSGTGNLATDPLFVDAPNGDLRLQACSPAIDAGSNAANSTSADLGGNARQVRTIDMGAYEYQGTPNQPVAITNSPPAGATFCAGSTVTVPVDVSGTAGTFEWYKGDQLLSGQTSATLSLSNVTPADAGSYKLKVIGACNTVETEAYVLAVDAASVGGSVSGSTSVCAGTNSTLLSLSGQTGAVQKWQSSPNGNDTWTDLANSAEGTYTATNLTQTTYYRAVVKSGVCAEALSSVATVTVDPLPTASLGTNNSPVCSGQNATFTVSGTSGATLTYTITGQAGSQMLALTGANQTITAPNATANVTLTLVSVAKDGCSQSLSGSSTVTVKALPTASLGTNNSPVCSGQNATFTVSGTAGATLTYTLAGQAGSQMLALTGVNQTITVSNATSDATLTLVSVEKDGCSQSLSGTSTVTVNALPTASLGNNNGPICAGQSASFTLSGTSGATLTYTITGQVGNQTLALTGGSQTLTVNSATSDATLTLVSVALNGCSQSLSGSSTVTVKPLPTASISTNNGPVCSGQTATFTVIGTNGATLTYTLTGQSGNQTLELTGTPQPITAPNATADVVLTLVSVIQDDCPVSLTASSTVAVKPLPTASITVNNGPICAGQTASFTVIGTNGATLTYTLTGQGGNQTLPLTGTPQTLTAPNATADVVLTLVSVTQDDCPVSLTGSSRVTVNALPTLTPGPNRTVILGYGSNCTDISATAAGAGPFTYAWSGSNSTTGTVNVCPQATTSYTVSVTDGNGCTSAQTQVRVDVQDLRCGNGGVRICLRGREICIAGYLVPTYLRLGAVLGSCGGGGNARMSAEEKASVSPLTLTLAAYPNPVRDEVTVLVHSPKSGGASLEVLDVIGRVRQSHSPELNEGMNKVELRLGTLPSGLYLIRVLDWQGRQDTIKVSKE